MPRLQECHRKDGMEGTTFRRFSEACYGQMSPLFHKLAASSSTVPSPNTIAVSGDVFS